MCERGESQIKWKLQEQQFDWPAMMRQYTVPACRAQSNDGSDQRQMFPDPDWKAENQREA